MNYDDEIALKVCEKTDFLFSFISKVAADGSLDYARRRQQIEMCIDQMHSVLSCSHPKLTSPTPIEEKFAKAVALESFQTVGWHSWSDTIEAIEWAAGASVDAIFGVAHQVIVHRSCGRHFRVDFMFAAPNYSGGPPFLIAVECDGHDFHEKTKEQAAADKARDREIVAAGITVLRFTGSEIWKDAEKCAQEVEALLWTRCHGTIAKPTPFPDWPNPFDDAGEAVSG